MRPNRDRAVRDLLEPIARFTADLGRSVRTIAPSGRARRELARLAGSRAGGATVLPSLAGAIGMARALRAAGDKAGSDAFLADVQAGLTGSRGISAN